MIPYSQVNLMKYTTAIPKSKRKTSLNRPHKAHTKKTPKNKKLIKVFPIRSPKALRGKKQPVRKFRQTSVSPTQRLVQAHRKRLALSIVR